MEKEKILNYLVCNSPFGQLMIDTDERCLYANSKACEMYCLKAEEINRSTTIESILPKQAVNPVREGMKCAIDNGVALVNAHVSDSTGIKAQEFYIVSIIDSDNNHVGFALTVKEMIVTEGEYCLNYMNSLEQQHLREILDVLPVSAYIWDAEANIVMVNKAAGEIWGPDVYRYTKLSEWTDVYSYYSGNGERLNPEDSPVTKAIREGKVSRDVPIEFYRFDGTHKATLNSVAPIWDASGKIVGAIEVEQDITEIKKLEGELEKAKAYLESVIDQMPIGVAVAEAPSGKILVTNTSLEKICEHFYDVGEREKYNSLNYYNQDMIPIRYEDFPLVKAITNGKLVEGDELFLGDPYENQSPLLSKAAPVRDKDGNIIGGVLVLIDISVLKERENKLRGQIKDIEKINTELQKYAYVTSHGIANSRHRAEVRAQLLRIFEPGHVDDHRHKLNGGLPSDARNRFKKLDVPIVRASSLDPLGHALRFFE